jgi:heterodisulfide reductase subunit A
MYTAKHAMLYKHRVHDGNAYVFYIDVRAAGKRYEEFYHRATEEDRVLFIRGKVARVFRDGDQIMVWGADTLSGQPVEIAADMVVLATAMIPRPETQRLAKMLRIPTDEYGFLLPADDNMSPVETSRPGVFLAGSATSPKDIPETVAQASAAAAKVLSLFAQWSGVPEQMMAHAEAEVA